MKDIQQQIERILNGVGAKPEALGKDELCKIDQAWLSAFAERVKQQTGNWIHEGFRWHSFSYLFVEALEGQSAMLQYRKQWAAPYVVFDENGVSCYRCSSDTYPEFSEVGDQILRAHESTSF